MDRVTRWLLWIVAGAVLMVVALIVYASVTGVFDTNKTPRTAQEAALATTADAIRKDPTNGAAYAERADALYQLGKKAEAIAVLNQGEQAVGNKEPALMIVLRSHTQMLNLDNKFAEAEVVGLRGMKASDDYLGFTGEALAKKGINVDQNLNKTLSVDMALQLAQAYLGEGKWQNAIDLYSYCLRLDPLAADVFTMRGWAEIKAGQKAHAKSDFQSALQYVPDDGDALNGMKALSTASSSTVPATSTAK